jgi:outer membrane protein assembly factor BamA
MDHIAFQGRALYHLWQDWSLGGAIDWRRRAELGVERSGAAQAGDPQRLFPDESGGALDLLAQQDSRDSKLFPSTGRFSQVLLRWVPPSWASLPCDQQLVQAEAETRAYRSLWPGGVLALRAMGASSWGDPSYLWRYRLGGVEVLRGFSDNRFRGQEYYAGQAELRFPIYKIITGACGVDGGDVGNPGFNQPRGSLQAGLRLALPPDWGQRARFDLGLAPDQWTFNVQFGEAF